MPPPEDGWEVATAGRPSTILSKAAGTVPDQAQLGEADAVDRGAVGREAVVAVAELDLLDRQRRAGGDAASGGAAVRVGRDHVDLDTVELAQGTAGGLQAGGRDAVVVGQENAR